MFFTMPSGLHRSYGAHHLHFITCSCYRRLPGLRAARSRDRSLSILEQTRERYRFVVVGYVVMPEHVHLLITEPEVGTPSTVMQVESPTSRKGGEKWGTRRTQSRFSRYACLISVAKTYQRVPPETETVGITGSEVMLSTDCSSTRK